MREQQQASSTSLEPGEAPRLEFLLVSNGKSNSDATDTHFQEGRHRASLAASWFNLFHSLTFVGLRLTVRRRRGDVRRGVWSEIRVWDSVGGQKPCDRNVL